jgi:hypothetical protein
MDKTFAFPPPKLSQFWVKVLKINDLYLFGKMKTFGYF